MTRFAVLRFMGDLETGLQVTLEWGKTGEAIEGRNTGQLEANSALATLYQNWQQAYRNLEASYRLEIEPTESGSLENCKSAAADLEDQLNGWLEDNSPRSFKAISRRLNQELTRHPDSQVLIQTDNFQLQRLPWHLWHFWEDHNDVEVVLSPLQYQKIQRKPRGSKTRVLAIMGDSNKINVTIDHQLLQELPGIDPSSCFLEEPSRTELAEALRSPAGWDILFFAGHSCSERDAQEGRIYINGTESITLSELKKTLKVAIDQGLKLAIFNSCDGLGLANSLAELQIPQTIVMREPVPDEVAHRFLAFFLESFSQGTPLVRAVKSARERLESIQDKLPYATWLPVLYKHPRAQPLMWQSGGAKMKAKRPVLKWAGAGVGLGALLLAGAAFSMARPPETQALGDRISGGEEILDDSNAPRLKRRGIEKLTKCQGSGAGYWNFFQSGNRALWDQCVHSKNQYHRAAQLLKQSWQVEQRDPETLIYLNNAWLEAQDHDYVTLAVAVPILRNEDGTVKNSFLAQELLRGVAQVQTEVNLSLDPARFPELTLPGEAFLSARSLKPGVGLKIVIADDSNNTDQAKARAQSLLAQKAVLGVVGHYASETTMATVEQYNSGKLPMVSPGSTTEDLSEDSSYPYFFRTVPTTGVEAQSLVDYLDQQGHRNAVMLYNPDSPFTDSLWLEFRQRFRASNSTQLLGIDLAAEDFDPAQVIQQIAERSTMPDGSEEQAAILLIPDGQVSNAFDNALEIMRLNQGRHPIAGSWGLYSSRTLGIGQAKVFEDLVINIPWHPANSPDTDFPQQAEQLWGGAVNTRTAPAYDAALAMIEAIARQNKPTRTGVRQQLSSADFSLAGVTGEIAFDPANGNRLNPPQTLIRALPCPAQKLGFVFVPTEFETPGAAGLGCQA